MQSPSMRAFRVLHPCKTIQAVSSGNPYRGSTCCKFNNHLQRYRKLHSTPYRQSPSSTAADWGTADSWSVYRSPAPPPTDDSSSKQQTPEVQTVHAPTTGSVVTRREENGDREPDPGAKKAESSSPHADSPSKQRTSEVQTIYDPMTGGFVTKRERNGAREHNPGAEKPEGYSPLSEVGTRVYGDVVGSSSASSAMKKKGKYKSVYVCESCGYSNAQWWGTCRQCEAVGTMTRFSVESAEKKVSRTQMSENVVRAWLPKGMSAVAPIKLSHVCGRMDESHWRIPLPGLFGSEVERVLGGGLVPGSLVLVSGDPGVGKSTLMLQVAALLAEGKGTGEPSRVIYVSGEESIEQIANRADRLRIETDELFLLSSTDIEEILEQSQSLSPKVIVIDSIQTAYISGVSGVAGGATQVKESTSALLRFAKKTNIPVLLTGHVTKTGEIAGPQFLEHIVDVVLYMEGERNSTHRLLRAVKNRFGSTDELGVFKMSRLGLQGISNPSEMFLGEEHFESDYLAGLAVTVVVDGSRAFLIEIQALCVASTSAGRHINGVPASRADMIISVIIKQAGLKLQENGIYLNVVRGVNLTETAGDLAIAAAICSSFFEVPIPNGMAFIAEIGLGGELRTVHQLEKRINTLAKLGYKKCIVPKSGEKCLSEAQSPPPPCTMEIVGCKNLKEMINTVFVTN